MPPFAGWNFAAAIGAAVLSGGLVWLWSRASRSRTLRHVERLAFHDPLTDLPNRLLFTDRATIAFANAKRDGTRVGVVFLDLDRFKLVNDSYGHDAGDEVLCGVARRLREQIREVDTVARLGGDEFTLIMPGLRQTSDVAKVASKLLDVFHLPIFSGGRELVVTASIGISMFPDDGSDAESLLKRADAAMYRAKKRGGDNFQVYTHSLDADARQELELEARLRRAITNKEFVLYYQPRVDALTDRIVAFEALLRWNDPQRGLVMPGDFMQVAEASGLIVPMGDWTLREACAQASRWHGDGCGDLVVSVNLSPRQFHRSDLVTTIEGALADAALPARFLELEVDESCVMNNADASLRIFVELKTLGVRVLISHFGAGYSSLSYLRRFPIDGLKLDRSFLTGADEDSRPLATAALGMARALRLKITGEGVETQEAADFLRSQFCDDLQGYLVSAAIPAQDCGRFINALTGSRKAGVEPGLRV